MTYTYEQLKQKNITELRDIAKGLQDPAVQGYSQMNKDHLLPALCRALEVDMHEHHAVTGIDKAGIKAKIRMLKEQRDAALDVHNTELLKNVRRQIHHLNRQIRMHLG